AAKMGQCGLRPYGMGERAFTERASADEITAMRTELDAAMRAGAFGFTSSRTVHHQTSDDKPVASRLASWDELRALVEVLGDLDVGVFQMVIDRSEPDCDPESKLAELAIDTGVPVATTGMTDAALAFVDDSIARGARMWGVTHPRGIGAFSSFRSQLPFDRLPEWRELRSLPIDEQRVRLEDPDVVTRLVK